MCERIKIWFLSLLICWGICNPALSSGIALTRGSVGDARKLWKVVPFADVERFSASVLLKFANGKSLVVTNDKLGHILEASDLSMGTLLTEEDLTSLKRAKESWQRQIVEFPQVKVYITPLLDVYSGMIERRVNGDVLIRGKWYDPVGYKKYLSGFQPSNSPAGAEDLTLGDLVVKNGKITSIYGDDLSILHDSGSSKIKTWELSDEQWLGVKKKFPDVFKRYDQIRFEKDEVFMDRLTILKSLVEELNVRIKICEKVLKIAPDGVIPTMDEDPEGFIFESACRSTLREEEEKLERSVRRASLDPDLARDMLVRESLTEWFGSPWRVGNNWKFVVQKYVNLRDSIMKIIESYEQ